MHSAKVDLRRLGPLTELLDPDSGAVCVCRGTDGDDGFSQPFTTADNQSLHIPDRRRGDADARLWGAGDVGACGRAPGSDLPANGGSRPNPENHYLGSGDVPRPLDIGLRED